MRPSQSGAADSFKANMQDDASQCHRGTRTCVVRAEALAIIGLLRYTKEN